MKRTLLILANIAFFFLASCSSSYNRGIVSAKAAAIPPHKILGNVEAKDCATIHNYLLFIPITMPANYKKMYNNVLEEATEMGGDAVINFQLRETRTINVFFLFMQYCYSAVGTAVKFSSGDASAWDAAPSGGSSVWDESPDAKKEQKKTKSEWD